MYEQSTNNVKLVQLSGSGRLLAQVFLLKVYFPFPRGPTAGSSGSRPVIIILLNQV